MSSQDSVPAIAEADAAGTTAELFSDIRKVLGVNVVNLVWRNLATIPGALEWVWSSVRPLYLEAAPAHADMIRSELVVPDIPAFSADTLASAGLSKSDVSQIQIVLNSYHHTNALALMVLSAMLAHNNTSNDVVVDTVRRPTVHSSGAMPRLLTMSELAPEVARLIEELNKFGEDSDTMLIASMYRHLAHWPTYLALTRTMLIPLERTGKLHQLVASARLKAHIRGRALATKLTISSVPETAAEALGACQRFVDHPIARMTVICAIMRRATLLD